MNKGVVFWTTLYLKLAYNFAGVHNTVAECQKLIQQGVALTWLARRAVSAAHAPGRRRATVHASFRRPAGPPAALQTTDVDDRWQPAKQYWPIRRAINNAVYLNQTDNDSTWCKKEDKKVMD